MLSPIFKLLTERLRKSQVSLNQLARIVDTSYKKLVNMSISFCLRARFLTLLGKFVRHSSNFPNLLVSLMFWIHGFLAESITDLVCSLYQSITDNKLNFCCRCFKWWMARRLREFRMVYVPPKQHLPPRVLYKWPWTQW